LPDKAALPKSDGGNQMSNESSEVFKIRSAPSGKFYVRWYGEAICLPDGSLRYFETERAAWAFLAECDRAEIGRLAA
jgi:hypothetical protein